jgi:acetylornithine deacetylase/succinyl-diaminopimelate desuccinylase-like protein
MAGLLHGMDESVRISSVELTLKAYYNLVKQF